MSAPSDRTVELRDKMNALIESIEGSDQEAYIMRCCVAVGVQELEKWMYDGEYTPSVKACSESVDFRNVGGAQAIAEELAKIDFEKPFSDWSEAEKMTFREGKNISFIKALRTRTNCGLKVGKAYAAHQRERYPNLWGSFAPKTS